MKKTTNLNLPVYDTPEVDTFKLNDWNTANETIDYVFGEFKDGATTNAVDITARQDLVNVNSQLAENTNEITDLLNINENLENANGKNILKIKNYLNNYQNIHPKVISFENKWNGFKYWMAYTPYPNGSTKDENPCIAVSNDLFIGWVTPVGLTNPLDLTPTVGYNSDTHLVYREDTNTMEIWWRHFDDTTNTPRLYRRTSTDGINWTAKEQITNLMPLQDTYLLSPTIIFEDGKYKMWYCGGQINYLESNGDTVHSWGNTTKKSINFSTLNVIAWHLDVIKTDLGYEYLIQGYINGVGDNNSTDLYYVLEKNDGTFTSLKKILSRSSNTQAIDYRSIYRSSFIKTNNRYYIYYSCIANDGTRSISVSYSKNLDALNGYVNINEKNEQNVLWSGDELLGDGVTLMLASNISTQRNGVVLTFRYYNNGVASNTRMYNYFVPKESVLNFAGGGHSIPLMGYSFDSIGLKYVSITDNSILGNTMNTQYGNTNGIVFDNSKFVLSKVYGV